MVKNINGLVLIDAPYSALNNAGTDASERTENITRTKIIRKGNKIYPYVSGQAFRYWWRMTLEQNFKWNLSPIERQKKIAFTEANPIEYPDDDIFGYMRAPKGKGSETLTRASVLKTSPLISVVSQRPTADFAVMGRHEGDPVPFEYEFYSTILKGIFSIDLDRAGVFSDKNRSGFKNLSKENLENAKENLTEIAGNFVLDKDSRIKRIQDVLKALYLFDGGAKQASNLTDVAPKFVILTTLNSGNHILMNILEEKDDEFKINLDALKKVLIEYKEQLLTDVYIGRRAGFLDSIDQDIQSFCKEMEKNKINIIYKIDIKEILTEYSKIIPELMK